MLTISLIQSDIYWEDKSRNLAQCEAALKHLSGKTDLAVFPEMFTTGFSMNVEALAETNDGVTVQLLRQWSAACGMALTGSFAAKETDGRVYNRAFFITPEGDAFFYDKRHLFRMGLENRYYAAGDRQLVVDYKGWRILPIVCYDIRFPVWTRNVNNAYDLLICCANWPDSRKKVWDILLQARAYENYCYVCGVNRVGVDGNGLTYSGGSLLVDARGRKLINASQPQPVVRTATIHKEPLERLRKKFPAWMDGDRFELRV
jgi:predicted amidohydrolase